MKRALLIVLLSFGTVAGYASGIHHLRHGGGCGWEHDQRWKADTDCPCPCHRSAAPPPAPQQQQPKAPENPPAP